MKILAIETTGAKASVAIIDDKKRIYELSSDRKLSHLQNLIPLIDDLLEKCKLSIDDMTHIAVSEGPGSFTGIRIGMATGKALAQGLGLPMINVPTLKSFCHNVEDFKGLVCPIFDARRDQVYGGAYYFDRGIWQRAIIDDAWYLKDYLCSIDEYASGNNKPVLFFGDGLEKYSDSLLEWGINTHRLSQNDDIGKIMAKPEDRLQKASSVALIALESALLGKIKSFENMSPVYLRKAEAERKLEIEAEKCRKGGSN